MRRILSILLALILVHTYMIGQQTPQKQIFFSFFARGFIRTGPVALERQEFRTQFTLTNPGERTATVSIRFTGRNGVQLKIPLQSVSAAANLADPFDIPPHSSTAAFTPFSTFGDLTSGSVKVESTEPITALESIIHLEIFNCELCPAPPVVKSSARVDIEPSKPTRVFSLTVIEDELNGSGISITLSDGSGPDASGTLTLFDHQGSKVVSRGVTVGPLSQLVQLVAQLFPELSSAHTKSGTIVGEFDRDVIVTGLTFSKTDIPQMSQNLLSGKVVQ